MHLLITKHKKSLQPNNNFKIKQTQYYGVPSTEEALTRYTDETTKIKVVFIGDGASGKSTWVKAFKITNIC
jgi:GTPase SAR1 family protein